MKRGYLWVDWVELGCRGWDIDQSGAQLLSADDEYAFAHLDRTTLDIVFGGSRAFLLQVVNDLKAAGLYVPKAQPVDPFYAVLPVWMLGTSNAELGATWTASTVVSHDMEMECLPQVWTHPSGATITITAKPEGRFRRWWRSMRTAYLAAIVDSFARFFQNAQKLQRDTDSLRKVA